MTEAELTTILNELRGPWLDEATKTVIARILPEMRQILETLVAEECRRITTSYVTAQFRDQLDRELRLAFARATAGPHR